jgi:hypothetical protein
MSEAFAEQFSSENPPRVIRLPGIISDTDLGLQEYSGDLLKPDAFINPALRHDMTVEERYRVEETNDNIWEG